MRYSRRGWDEARALFVASTSELLSREMNQAALPEISVEPQESRVIILGLTPRVGSV
jgi:hypothetical protein